MARRVPRELPWRLVCLWHDGRLFRGRYQVDRGSVTVTALGDTVTVSRSLGAPSDLALFILAVIVREQE